MAVETEVKIELSDADEFRRELRLLNATLLSGRHFEDNFVLDFPDGRLRSQSCLLRVRKTKGEESVTFKGPPQPSALFKSREEVETQVADSDTMLRLFEHLGMTVWFRYQKFREEYSIPAGAGPEEVVKVALDSTPIGEYAELEGSEGGIREIAEKLGLSQSRFLRESYYGLYVQFCRQNGASPKHMVFPEQGGEFGIPG